MTKRQKKGNTNKTETRPPVVVVLGHVDHGKTSILDYIKKTKVTAKEAGGITQHIGAYQIETTEGKKITFIDTPGHEAFSAMRSRGARVADIAILVVAADEGIKPQTKEAINHIKKAGLSYLVAFNKIDKPEANPERIKQALAENEVFLESYGGQVPSVNVSAKTGQGIDELLEMILLLAEMEELEYDPAAPASGVVIESNLDARKGVTATLLVKEGVLKTKDAVAAESTFGPVKNIQNWQGENMLEVVASTPVEVIGLVGVPFVGETWQVEKNIEEAEKKSARKKEVEEPKRKHLEVVNLEEGQKVLNIILKADTIGTLEAIRQSLEAIDQEKVVLRIIEESTGEISDHDIQLASSANAPIFSFRVKRKSTLQDLIERENVKIQDFEIIYELIQSVRESMGELLDPEIIKNKLGEMEILALFKSDGRKKIVGGRVRDGLIQRGAKVDIFRDGEYIGDGRITQLQHDKKDIAEVGKGKECGLLVESEQEIEIGDTLENYKEEKRKQTL